MSATVTFDHDHHSRTFERREAVPTRLARPSSSNRTALFGRTTVHDTGVIGGAERTSHPASVAMAGGADPDGSGTVRQDLTTGMAST